MDEKDILNSWKEISRYLEHNAKTCYRWEKNLGLPIHRYDNDSSKSTVFAYKSELDEWVSRRISDKDNIGPKKSIIKTKKFTFASLIFLTSLIVIISFFYIRPFNRMFSSTREAISIGVQSFENGGSSEYDEYLAQGITDEIKSNLSRSENFKVITIPLTKKPIDEEAQKKNIKADYILTGRIQREKNQIGLRYELTSTKNHTTILEKNILEKFENIQQMNDDICRQIHERLDIAYNSPISNPIISPLRNNEAFEVYLKGKYILNHINNKESNQWNLYLKGKYFYGSYTRESNEIAIELFNAAIEANEKFMQAYVGLAQCYINYINLGWDNSIKWLDKAESILNKVDGIYPKCPEYFSSLTKLYLLKYLDFNEETDSKAYESVKKGLEKHPENYNLNVISSYCFFLKYGEKGDRHNFEKALEFGEKSFWQNPFSINNLFYTELLLLNEQFKKGLEICATLKKVDRSLMSTFRIGELYYYSGDLEKSREVFSQIESPLNIKIGALFYLGMIASQNYQTDEVIHIIKKLENLSIGLLEDDLRLASMHFGIGNDVEGFKCLDKFLKKTSTQKLKFTYWKYINLDKNFHNYIQTIRRKYFE
jgi:TolB-like protein